MPRLILPQRQTRQPQGAAQIDGKWISAGLQSVISFAGIERNVFGALDLSRSGTGHKHASTSGGVGTSQNNGANLWTTNSANKIIGIGSNFAVCLTFKFNSIGQGSRYVISERAVGEVVGSFQFSIVYGFVTNTFELHGANGGYSGSDPRPGSKIVVADVLPHTLIYSYDGVTFSGYLDGNQIFSYAISFSVGVSGTGRIGAATASGVYVSDMTFIQHARFDKGLSNSAARSLSANPWQLFKEAPSIASRSLFSSAANDTIADAVEIASAQISSDVINNAVASHTEIETISSTETAALSMIADVAESSVAQDNSSIVCLVQITLQESAVALDALQGVADFVGSLTESSNATDTISRILSVFATAAENGTAIEVGQGTVTGAGMLVDNFAAVDTITNIVAAIAQAVEILTLQESSQAAYGTTVGMIEIVSAADANECNQNTLLSSIETAVATNTQQILRTANINIIEIAAASGIADVLLSFNVVVSELIQVLDDNSVSATLRAALSELHSVHDLVRDNHPYFYIDALPAALMRPGVARLMRRPKINRLLRSGT